MQKTTYKHTIYACYLGYIVQAAGNNFAPLLFVIWGDVFGIPTGQITMLIALNFMIQLTVDLISAKFIDRVGYRRAVIAAHIFSAVGLAGLAVFPFILGDSFNGLLIAVFCYAVGGGLIEVLISPIVEACPTDSKSSAMSLLHSFYCWGTVFVILVSTAVLGVFGTGSWRILACVWAVLPAANAFIFTRVPILTLADVDEKRIPAGGLLSSRIFWVLVLLMIASGASEQGMIQWASMFAERGLGVTKTVGDIVGPCLFAVLMGVSRVFYAKKSESLDLLRCITWSGVLCAASYLCAAFSPVPLMSLFGCALCGLSVGILWPGVFSVAAVRCRGGGTTLFALLALAGDLGCTGGPSLVGGISGLFGDSFTAGLASAVVFPVMLIACSVVCRRMKE